MDEASLALPGCAAGRAPARLDEAVLAGGILAYGIVLQRVIPERWHVPANVAAALASVAAARRAGPHLARML